MAITNIIYINYKTRTVVILSVIFITSWQQDPTDLFRYYLF